MRSSGWALTQCGRVLIRGEIWAQILTRTREDDVKTEGDGAM